MLSMLLIAAPLVGYGFTQAMSLFSEASRAALEHKELAPGMNPLEGVLVPVFGSLYLVTTLLFPFVAIRPVSMEKQSGSLKLILQLRNSPLSIILLKAAATFLAWSLAFSTVILAIVWWKVLGGHAHLPELFNLALGHSLYAFVILGLSFLISSITGSSSTAAIFVLGVTLGSWVLDFSASTQSGETMRWLPTLSLTAALRNFERGLFSSPDAVRLLIIGFGSLLLSSVFIQIGKSTKEKISFAGIVSIGCLALIALGAVFPFYRDLSEDRRNSLPIEDEAIFRALPHKVDIRIFLTPDDPRYRDLERQLLSKFRRTIPHVQVKLMDTGKTALYGVGGTDNYGLNQYEYDGQVEQSRSTSPREILPIIHRLTGNAPPQSTNVYYPGYPLVAGSEAISCIFYLVFPLFFIALWWWSYRLPRNFKLEVTNV